VIAVGKLLVVCTGNLCRSPLGAALLRGGGFAADSAGLRAAEGRPADPATLRVAARHGVSLDGHMARAFAPALAGGCDLILTMEPAHRFDILRDCPHLSGRVMAFDHWTGGRGIADPFRRPAAAHEAAFQSIARNADEWLRRIAPAEAAGC